MRSNPTLPTIEKLRRDIADERKAIGEIGFRARWPIRRQTGNDCHIAYDGTTRDGLEPSLEELQDVSSDVPDWVWKDRYANNPVGQQLAIARYSIPVTTPAERQECQAWITEPAHECAGCGKYSFEKPKLCFWCRRGITT